MRYFEDLYLAEEVQFEGEYLVTEEEIIEVGKRWDPQPFHIDPVAAVDSIFGGLVASSAHIFSIWVGIGHSAIDKEKKVASVSALGFNNLQWHSPVRPNDVLRSAYKTVAIRESRSKPHLGIVVNQCVVTNQSGEDVFTLECSFLVPKRDSAHSALSGKKSVEE
jgi:acyl dehydratase